MLYIVFTILASLGFFVFLIWATGPNEKGKIKDMYEELDKYAERPEGWDGDNAMSFSKDVILLARGIVSRMSDIEDTGGWTMHAHRNGTILFTVDFGYDTAKNSRVVIAPGGMYVDRHYDMRSTPCKDLDVVWKWMQEISEEWKKSPKPSS